MATKSSPTVVQAEAVLAVGLHSSSATSHPSSTMEPGRLLVCRDCGHRHGGDVELIIKCLACNQSNLCYFDNGPAWEPPSLLGEELTRRLRWIRKLRRKRKCRCGEHRRTLNGWPLSKCEANVGTIVEMLRDGARELAVPFSAAIAERLVRRSIRKLTKERQASTPTY